MPKGDSHGSREALRRASETVSFAPDLDDVEGRLKRGAGRRRLLTGTVALLIAGMGIGSAALVVGRLGSDAVRPVRSMKLSIGSQRERPPEGKVLLQVGRRGRVVEQSGRVVEFEPDFWVSDLSPYGGSVLAARVEPAGQGSRTSQLVQIDLQSGARPIIARADAEHSLGVAKWSPEGTKVAYTFGTVELSQETSDPIEQTACVLVLQPRHESCFSNLGLVYSIDWSPTGEQLVVAGPGNQPVLVVDVATGQGSELIPPGGNESIRQGMREAGLGDVAQFVDPQWSASGTYVAAQATVVPGGFVPIVVRAVDGELVALGKPNLDVQYFEWSPLQDVLAYTTGVNVPDANSPPWAVYLLEPVSGESRLLLSTQGEAQERILGLKWSPTGRWLALDNFDRILIVDTASAEILEEVVIDTQGDPAETLRDWGT